METKIWIILAVIILAVIFGIIAAFAKNKYKRPTDYKAFFTMGIIWFAIGLPLKNYALFIMGLVFMGVGLAHKDKWEDNKRSWPDLSKQERAITFGSMALALLVFIVGVIAYFFVKQGI